MLLVVASIFRKDIQESMQDPQNNSLQKVHSTQTKKITSREKIEDYLQFLTYAGETRFSIFAWESLGKLSHFVNCLDGVLTITLEIV